MRILHLCLGNFYIDNYSYQENLLTKYHVKMGHEVTVIASLFTYGQDGKGTFLPHSTEYDDANGVHIIRLNYKKPRIINHFLRRYIGLESAIERFSPDIIFSHNVSYADTTVVARYLQHHQSVMAFADDHADYINSAKNWLSKHILHPIIWRHYAKLLGPYLTRCYGVTPMRCRFLVDMYHINPQLVEFLPMGVDDEAIPANRAAAREAIRNELSISDSDILMITGGKIDLLKNTHVLIRAMELLNEPTLHLVICGTLTPEMENLKIQIENNPHIHYLGWCTTERVMNCMLASDFACFPGTHSTLWEQSVGIGLPSIFKRWNEMEHVNVNDNCLFVKGDDVNELKEALKKMIEPSFFERIKQKAAVASKSFLYSEIAKRAIEP